jgi:5-methylcytosine-specific restriction endonuclease McrA
VPAVAGVRALDTNMKNKKLNAVHVWKQFEDLLAPRLKLSLIDRAVYSNLVRHSQLEGKRRLHFSIPWLAQNIGLTVGPVRESVRRFVDLGVFRLLHRSNQGHVVEVRLPAEIPAARGDRIRAQRPAGLPSGAALDELDFQHTRVLRQSIHAREGGVCFYCLRRIPRGARSLDHVVPRVESGRNSYRNLVSCCMECNSRKRQRPAGDYVRWLYREGQLTSGELIGRLRALKALAAGKLRPRVFQWESGKK